MPSAPPTGPDPVIRLLWRHWLPAEETPRRGRKQRLTVDAVVDAGIELADAAGLDALSMRSLAQHLGLPVMTVYGYVPGRSALVVLMVDQALGRTTLPALPGDLRERLELVARVQHADYAAHPWILEANGLRPWLGPSSATRYEWQLSAVDAIGLTDLEMDQTLAVLVGLAATVAGAQHDKVRAERETGLTELAWWEANAGELAEVVAGHDFPLAARVGQAAGDAYQAASDPASELDYGLARLVDGLLRHLERRA